MKRNWKGDQEIEKLAMANCLMLVNQGGRSFDSDKSFHCKTCNKQFSSFQALGGHRTSHKRPKSTDELLVRSMMHECSICGLEFELEQALEDHMWRHHDSRPNKTFVKEVDDAPRGFCLDLNLTPFQNHTKRA